jgi:hypothetical protein
MRFVRDADRASRRFDIRPDECCVREGNLRAVQEGDSTLVGSSLEFKLDYPLAHLPGMGTSMNGHEHVFMMHDFWEFKNGVRIKVNRTRAACLGGKRHFEGKCKIVRQILYR